MIIFVFGLSGSGKSYISKKIQENIDSDLIKVSDVIKKYGTLQVQQDCSKVVSDISDLILKGTQPNVIVDGIRQPDIYYKIVEQLNEKHINVIINSDLIFTYLRINRGLPYVEIYSKLKLDFDLGIVELFDLCNYSIDNNSIDNTTLYSFINYIKNKEES